MVGGIEVQLDAVRTDADKTAGAPWIAILQDVDAAGIVTDITAGYLRARLAVREVDEAASRPGAPDLPCRTFQAVPIGEPLRYRIPLVANAPAGRFRAGHRVRLFLTNNDQDPNTPASLTFRGHASVGTSCLTRQQKIVVAARFACYVGRRGDDLYTLKYCCRSCRAALKSQIAQPP